MCLQCSHLKRDCLADKKKTSRASRKIPARHAGNEENALFFGYYFTIFKGRVLENRKLNTKQRNLLNRLKYFINSKVRGEGGLILIMLKNFL
jgi:hypothetical protein